jgi:hypothetical protein
MNLISILSPLISLLVLSQNTRKEIHHRLLQSAKQKIFNIDKQISLI